MNLTQKSEDDTMSHVGSLFAAFLLFLASGLYSFASANTETEVTYYHPDRSGSPIAASDESGNVTWTQRYEPFGYRIDADSNANKAQFNRIGFVGQYEEKGAGEQLVYMQGRFYDPVLGRFLSVDPVDFQVDVPLSFNRYAYSFNNPYSYADSDGEFPFLLVYYGVTAALTAYDKHTAYKEGGVAGAGKTLARDVVLTAVGGKALSKGLSSVLVTGVNTHVSGPAKKAFDQIIRRNDLGPKK